MTTEELIDSIAKASRSGDWVGVQHYLGHLRTAMADEGKPLHNGASYRLIEALSEGAAPGVRKDSDPYRLVEQIRETAAARPVDLPALRATWNSLYGLLADPSMPIESAAVKSVLSSLKMARAFDLLAKTADRALVRLEDDAAIRCQYGQALINSGQAHAGIEMLATIPKLASASKEARDEAKGLMGRAAKQIYVDHVSRAAVPYSVRASFRPYLQQALDSYAAVFNADTPAINYWQGINIVALLSLAQRDGHDQIRNPAGHDAEEIARRLLEALEPQAASTREHWLLATLGEAAIAVGDPPRASRHYAAFVRHRGTDAFALASAVRQLEEVWRLAAGDGWTGAILAILKAAQIAKPEGKFSLPGDGLQELGDLATSREFKDRSANMETMVPGGEYVKLGDLQRVVARAAAIAAVCNSNGRTMGTGFLMRGGDLCESWGNGLVLVTNAHVMSDPRQPGAEPRSLDPKETRLVLEAAGGAPLQFDPHVIFQSPVSEYDTTIVRITDSKSQLTPLPLADKSVPLEVENAATRAGTRVSVIGHPLGGPLSLSLVGSLSGANGVLVDIGPQRAQDEKPVYLHYRAPTEPGNSGSPVFETKTWGVVGLHHMGFSQFEGGLPKLRGVAGKNLANEGISIRSISEAITRKDKRSRTTLFNRRQA